MNKRLFTIIFIFLALTLSLYSEPNSNEKTIILTSEIQEIPYTLSVFYGGNPFDSEYIYATGFDTDYNSENFTIKLSKGNKPNESQYIITITPGYFENNYAYDYVTNSYKQYILPFKPTPTASGSFQSQTSSYNPESKKLTITSKIIESGLNESQSIAKFSLGWNKQVLAETTPPGMYISTVVIEYIYNDLSNSL
jgi:hypothetical protein